MSWQTLRFKDFVTLQRGFDLPKSQMQAGEVPVLGSNSIIGFHNESKVKGPGVVTGRSGTLGWVQYTEYSFWPHNTALWVKDFKGNDPKYVYYKLQTLHLERFNGGVSVPTLNRNVLDTLQVKIPKPSIQQRITSILSAYDDLIENNRRRIQLLEQTARLLYKEWFVHLRFPSHEHVKITDGVPEGWETHSVGEQTTLIRGKSYKSSELVESGGKPFVNLKCVARHGGFRLDGLKRFSGKHRDEQVVLLGDIVIAVTDMTRERHVVAHPARVPAAIDEEAVFSMDTVKIIPDGTVDKAWFYYFLRYSSFSKDVREHATGTNVLHLKPKQIEDYLFTCPPWLLQVQFGEIARGILAQQDNLIIQNENLAQARDLLLPRLMNGEIAV